MDGIKCFDLDNSDLGGEDLIMSLGGKSNVVMEPHNMNESLHLW